MKFKQHLNELEEINEMEIKIQALLFLSENIEMLNESDELLETSINKHLNKLGLKIHKAKGIIDYVKTFTGGIGRIVLHIIKGDTEKAKKLLLSVKKEDVLDFLYKLDLGTLHLVTGPLHAIDAWTGWDLGVNLASHMKKADSMIDIFKNAIEKVKTAVHNIFTGDKQRVMLNHVHRIEVGVPA